MASNPYRRATTNNPYVSTGSQQTEPDMRQELINTFDGYFPEIAKAQYGLFRKMRRTAAGALTACDCVDDITREPDKDRFCPICYGEGYLWDETLIQFYKRSLDIESGSGSAALRDKLTQLGLINVSLVVFYTRYDLDITQNDKIVEINLEDDGSVPSSIKRLAIYRVNSFWGFRSDNAKLEYYKILTHEELVKYLNAPTYDQV